MTESMHLGRRLVAPAIAIAFCVAALRPSDASAASKRSAAAARVEVISGAARPSASAKSGKREPKLKSRKPGQSIEVQIVQPDGRVKAYRGFRERVRSPEPVVGRPANAAKSATAQHRVLRLRLAEPAY